MGVEWHRSLLHIVENAKEKGIVFYGAGFWGKIAYDLFGLFGVKPICFCDDDIKKHETMYCGVPVFSLEEAVDKHKGAIYIVCVDETLATGEWNRKARNDMITRLQEKGVYSADSEMHLPFYVFLLDIGLDVVNIKVERVLSEDMFVADELKQIILFNNMSNSGSYYLEQLLDGHTHMLFLPYIESLERVYVKRLQYLQGEELLIEMMAQMLGYFHSQYEDIGCVGQHRFQNFCVDEKGEFISDILMNPVEFMTQLRMQFGKRVKLNSYAHMLKIYFAAYNNCLGRKKQGKVAYWMFYHMHLPNFDVTTMYENLHREEFNRIENLVIIREPVQHCYSWIRRFVMKEKNNVAVRKAHFPPVIKSELGMMLEKRAGYENVRAIKFEDCKYHTEATMKSLCAWLNIPFEVQMLDTTVNGFTIYFPANTPTGVKYITGNDTSTVKLTDFSEVLTLWDQTRLDMIFGKFKRAYEYDTTVPAFTEWSKEERTHILEADFKLANIVENVILEKGSKEEYYDVNAFIESIFLEYMDEYEAGTEYYEYIRPIGTEENE